MHSYKMYRKSLCSLNLLAWSNSNTTSYSPHAFSDYVPYDIAHVDQRDFSHSKIHFNSNKLENAAQFVKSLIPDIKCQNEEIKYSQCVDDLPTENTKN